MITEKTKEKIATSAVHTHSSHNSIDLKDDKFFLCNNPIGSEDLHNASTYDIDVKVHRCAVGRYCFASQAEPGEMIACS